MTYLLIISNFICPVEATEISDFNYVVDGAYITITSYTGTDPNIVIPSQIDGKPVTELDYYFYCTNVDIVESILLPETISSIGLGNLTIENIYLDSNNPYFVVDDGVLYSSNYNMIYKCQTNVETFEIPETVKYLEWGCFRNSSIEKLTIPDTVIDASEIASMDCLKELTIESPIEIIDIYGCSNLEIVNLPNTIEYGIYINDCDSLQAINIAEGSETFYSVDGVVFKGNGLLYYPNGKTDTRYVIPDGIESIDSELEISNPYIQELVFSKDLQTISVDNFVNCSSLNTIEIPDENPYFTFNDGMLCKDNTLMYYVSNENNKKIVVPDNVTAIEEKAFAYNSFVEEIVLPDGLQTIGAQAFLDCSQLKTINIPKNVNNLYVSYYNENAGLYYRNGDYVFEGCTALKNIEVDPENSAFVVSDDGFYTSNYDILLKCLTDDGKIFEINENTKCVEMEAFRNCNSLKNVDLKNVTSIMYCAFVDCTSLESINFPNVVNFNSGMTFANCTSLVDIKLPDGFLSCTTSSPLFKNCTSLTNIDLNNIEIFNERSLYRNCENIKELIIPSSVSEINFSIYQGATYYVYDNSTALELIEATNQQILEGNHWFDSVIDVKVIKGYTDANTNITIDTLKNNLDESTTLTTSIITQGGNYDAIKEVTDNFTLYDINLSYNDQAVILNDDCEISIPLPANINSENFKVYYIDENNRYENINATYDQGFIRFKTNNLGKFVITDTELEQYLLGDLNYDNKVDYNDAVIILQVDSNTMTLTESQKIIANVNGDNDIDYNDAVLILRKDAGLIKEF